jgi:amidase
MIKQFNASLSVMRSLGAEIVENTDFSEYKDDLWTPDSKIVYALDFKTGIKNHFGKLKTNPNKIWNLEDLMRYTKETPEEEYPARDIALWEEAMTYPYEDNTSEFFAEAYERLYKWGTEGGIAGALNRYGLDALVLPTDFANHPAGPAGLPSLSFPMGFPPPDMKQRNGRGGLLEAGPNIP